ncbi:MAG: MBOAT family protein [Oscillospiraceae bacterium]|nr:MBOAT family protein [Oscillospiraceae bacterium]
MVFSDLLFLYIFIPALMICYSLARAADGALAKTASGSHFELPRSSSVLSNGVLIIFSLIFYAWGEPVYVFLMVISVVINYIVGLFIDRGEYKSKAALIFGLVVNIGIIGVFKYADFIIGSINFLGLNIPQPNIGLPIGISFYTFQSISYLADVYRGEVPAQKSFASLLLYISMFPQLVAGPIVRYETISAEIDNRRITFTDLSEGSFRFLIGLGKKVILANELSELSAQFLDADLSGVTVGGAWIGILAYTFQIYFDFSGYSDMAIGMGRCLGFHFNENFNYPYVSCTITEFWRRWHISLGSFFRDYVYIPLGGNRRHQPLNIMVVWFLTGLWHGASWNFVLWGVYFGVIVLLEKYTILKIRDKIPSVLLHIYSMFLIIFGWVIFYFDDFSRLGEFIGVMFGAGSAGAWDTLTKSALLSNLWLLIAAAILSLPVGKLAANLYEKAGRSHSSAPVAAMTAAKTVCAAAILIVSTLLLIGNTTNAFLYTRF